MMSLRDRGATRRSRTVGASSAAMPTGGSLPPGLMGDLADAAGRAYAVALIGVDVTVHRQREARFEQQAMTDALTGVANRGMLFSLLGHCLDPVTGAGGDLLFCDLDEFKTINDTWGSRGRRPAAGRGRRAPPGCGRYPRHRRAPRR